MSETVVLIKTGGLHLKAQKILRTWCISPSPLTWKAVTKAVWRWCTVTF